MSDTVNVNKSWWRLKRPKSLLATLVFLHVILQRSPKERNDLPSLSSADVPIQSDRLPDHSIFFNTNEESIEFYLSIFCWQSFTGFERVTVKNSEELQVLKLVLNFKDFSYKGKSIFPMPILESTSGITAAVLMLLGFLKCEKFLEKFSGGAVKPSNPEDSCCMMSYNAAVRTPA